MKKLFIVGMGMCFVLLATHLFSSSDEEEILALLDETVFRASFEGSIHPIQLAQYATSLLSPVADDIEIVANYGVEQSIVLEGRKALQQRLLLVRRHLDQLAVALSDISIDIDGTKAMVELEGRAMGRSSGRDDYFLEQHELLLSFQYTDGSWKLVKAMNKNPLDPGQYPRP